MVDSAFHEIPGTQAYFRRGLPFDADSAQATAAASPYPGLMDPALALWSVTVQRRGGRVTGATLITVGAVYVLLPLQPGVSRRVPSFDIHYTDPETGEAGRLLCFVLLTTNGRFWSVEFTWPLALERALPRR